MEDSNLDRILVENGNFSQIYNHICDCLRKSGNLNKFQSKFENLKSDLDRIKLLKRLCDFKNIRIEKEQFKDCNTASELEKLFDHLVKDTSSLKSAAAISKSLQHTLSGDKKRIVRRYSKRAWNFLLRDDLESAIKDANQCLKYDLEPIDVWKPQEVLGHCYAKSGRYGEARTVFAKALESLRSSEESNSAKAEAAKRMAVRLKNMKGLTDKPSKLHSELTKLQLPTPFGGRNASLFSASSKVDLKYSSKNGRGLYANQDIQAGSIIIAENPYASVLSESRWDTHCIHCLRCVTSPVPCDGCSKVWFCCEACKQNPNAFHHRECPILVHLHDETLGIMAPLVIRIMLTRGYQNLKKDRSVLEELMKSGIDRNQDPEICDHYSSENYLAVFNQVTNSDKRQFGTLFKRGLAAIFMTLCLQSVSFFGEVEPSCEELDFIAGLIFRHMQSCSCNAYEICEIDTSFGNCTSLPRGVGGAVYSTISLSNHSCAPNCHRYNVGIAGIFRSCKFIKKGEEICDNYGHFYFSEEIDKRQGALRSNYLFDCSCIACANDWPTYTNEDKDMCFNCPQVNCRSVITDCFGVRGCDKCYEKKFYKKFLNRIKQKVQECEDVKELMKSGNIEEAFPLLVDQQTFLDSLSVQSNKYYIRVQEMIRQCYFLMGNTVAHETLSINNSITVRNELETVAQHTGS